MTDFNYCPVCEAEGLEVLKTYRFAEENAARSAKARLIRHYLNLFHDGNSSATVNMMSCPACGFLFTNPRLSTADLVRKYSTIAEEDKSLRNGPPPHLTERRERITELVAAHRPAKGSNGPLDILDYGGAEGYLLTPLIDRGHRGYVMDYIDYPKEDERITHLPITDLTESDRRYDFVFLFHVLEHVAEPVDLLRRLATMLKPGGRLCIEVPLGNWLEWEDLREPLTHVNFFGEQSLAAAAERAGLDVVAIDTEWQYTTHPNRSVCVNLVGGINVIDHVRPSVRPAARQIKPLHQLIGGVINHPRYYLKTALKSIFNG